MGDARTTGPPEVAAGQLDTGLLVRRARLGVPPDVGVPLLVEATVDRHPPDLTRGLQQPERRGQRRAGTATPSGLAEAAHPVAERAPQRGGIHPGRARVQRVEHGRRERVDLRAFHAQLRERGQGRQRGGPSDLQPQREVRRRQHVRAAPCAGQLVDLQVADGRVGLGTGRPGPAEQREVRVRAADGASPPGGGEHVGGGNVRQRAVETLTVSPPGAQRRKIHGGDRRRPHRAGLLLHCGVTGGSHCVGGGTAGTASP